VGESGIIYLIWGDLTGLARCRGLPLGELEEKSEAGLGWACAGHALTPFEAIVPNVWGPMAEARQIPDLATRFEIPAAEGHPAVHGVLCDSKSDVDREWDCCVRTFLRRAVEDLRA
jgi:glutamine synthetase